jgi:hypothetical protein
MFGSKNVQEMDSWAGNTFDDRSLAKASSTKLIELQSIG